MAGPGNWTPFGPIAAFCASYTAESNFDARPAGFATIDNRANTVEAVQTSVGLPSDPQPAATIGMFSGMRFLASTLGEVRSARGYAFYFPTAFHTSALVCGAAEVCTLIYRSKSRLSFSRTGTRAFT
jgi:hypothetical protein